MPSYKRPGVYVEEVLNLSQALNTPGVSTAAFAGAHYRGPVTPVLVQSWSDFLANFGGFSPIGQPLAWAVHQFFSNGGGQAYVCRVAGPSSTASTRTLKDTLTVIDTLKIDAINPGTWGQGIYIETSMSGTDRFNLIIRFGGSGDAYIVERWLDLSMDTNDSRYVQTLVNSVTSGSLYVRVTDMNSASTPPADRPAVTSATALAGPGSDPTASGTELTAALSTFDFIDGPLTFNMPGVATTAGADNATVQANLLAYCLARGDCFAVLDPAENLSAANAVAAAAAAPSAYGALYFPWIYISDPSSNAAGGIKKVAPGGAVLGQYSRVDTLRGVHKAPAGIDTRLAGAVAVETKLSNVDLDTLSAGLVNAIRQMPGVGVAIMGARTLKSTSADRYVSTRRTLNYIRVALLNSTRWALFEPNDSTLWGGLSTQIQSFLLQMWQQKALRGGTPAEAFYVKCDDSNNTQQSIAAGQVNIEVGVALQYPAEFVVIRIGQWQGGSTAVVTV